MDRFFALILITGHVFIQEVGTILHLTFANLTTRSQTIFMVSCVKTLHCSDVFSTFPIVCQDASTTKMQPPSGMLHSWTGCCRSRRTRSQQSAALLVLIHIPILHFGAFMTMFWINCSSIVTFPMRNFYQLDIHRDCRTKLHNSDTSDLDLLVCLSLSSTSGGSFSTTTLKSKTVFPETCSSDVVSVHGCSSGGSSPAPSPGGNSSTRSSLASVRGPTASRRLCDFSWRLRSA